MDAVYACVVDASQAGVFDAHILLSAYVFILLRRPAWVTAWHESSGLAFLAAVQFVAVGTCPPTEAILTPIVQIATEMGGCDKADVVCIKRALNHFRWGMLAAVAAWAVVKMVASHVTPVAAPPAPARVAHAPVMHPATTAPTAPSPPTAPVTTAPPPVTHPGPREAPAAVAGTTSYNNCGTAIGAHHGPLTINCVNGGNGGNGGKRVDVPNWQAFKEDASKPSVWGAPHDVSASLGAPHDVSASPGLRDGA